LTDDDLKSKRTGSKMSSEIGKVAKLVVKSVSSGESVPLETLWSNQTCFITFLRRFG